MIYRLVTLCFMVLVCGRFFVSTVKLLPQVVTFIDFLVYPFVLFSLLFGILGRRERRIDGTDLAILLFIAVTGLSLLVNLSNTRVGLAVFYVFTMVGGPAVAGMLGKMEDAEQNKVRQVNRLIRGITILNILLVLFYNLPYYFLVTNPDVVTGTFGYQGCNYLVVFVATLYGVVLGNFAGRGVETRWFVINYGFWVVVFVIAQFRAASLGFFACNILAVFILLRYVITNQRQRRIIYRVAIVGVFAYIVIFPRFQRSAETAYETGKFSDVFNYIENPSSVFRTPKVLESLRVIQLYEDNPLAILLGMGPGSIMSRGFQLSQETFQLMTRPTGKPVAAHQILWDYVLGREPLDTKLQRKYAPLEDTSVEAWLEGRGGSYVTEMPYASIYSLLMETGVLSFALILFIYITAVRKTWSIAKNMMLRKDGIGAGFALGGLFGLIHILSIIWADNYFETQFITYPTWFMVGMAYARAEYIRSQAARQAIETPVSPMLLK